MLITNLWGADALTLRRATAADARTLSALSSQTFTETFGPMYPPEDLAHFLSTAYAVEAFAEQLARPDFAFWLLEHEGVAVGHALCGPCSLPHPDVMEGDGELKRLYLVRSAQHRGWGERLLRTALAWLSESGPRTLWIGVWSENFGAQRLYARHGFSPVGQYYFPVGKTRDLELILKRSPG